MTELFRIATLLRERKRFLLTTHRDPDADGIGAMLALGRSLRLAGKKVVFLFGDSLPDPLRFLKGGREIVQGIDPGDRFDAVVALDCSEIERVAGLSLNFKGRGLLINIDHHETNASFGYLNLVDARSSSTGELVYRVIKAAELPIDPEVAENIFAAIQADTGSFRYLNTSASCLKIAAEMLESYGVRPWDVSRSLMDGYGPSRLRLLRMALGTLEFHHDGRIGIMTLSLEMFEEAGAHPAESERFVDYPRLVRGVEIGVLIRQTEEDNYKFSLRSNTTINVALLSSRFGGGGHAMAAGFECQGNLMGLKRGFLREAARFLDGRANRRNTSGR